MRMMIVVYVVYFHYPLLYRSHIVVLSGLVSICSRIDFCFCCSEFGIGRSVVAIKGTGCVSNTATESETQHGCESSHPFCVIATLLWHRFAWRFRCTRCIDTWRNIREFHSSCLIVCCHSSGF